MLPFRWQVGLDDPAAEHVVNFHIDHFHIDPIAQFQGEGPGCGVGDEIEEDIFLLLELVL